MSASVAAVAVASDGGKKGSVLGAASKLFVGVDVAEHLDPAVYDIASLDGETKQEHLHLTFQYCGEDISHDNMIIVRNVWKHSIRMLGSRPEDLEVEILPEFALFGREGNVLVIKCRVSDALLDAIKVSRQHSSERVKEIPSSDFPFSAHVTLGKSHTLPNPSSIHQENFGKFNITQITLWGDDYTVRDWFPVDELIAASQC